MGAVDYGNAKQIHMDDLQGHLCVPCVGFDCHRVQRRFDQLLKSGQHNQHPANVRPDPAGQLRGRDDAATLGNAPCRGELHRGELAETRIASVCPPTSVGLAGWLTTEVVKTAAPKAES